MSDGLLSDTDLGLSFGPIPAARPLDIRPAAPAPIPGSQPTSPADALPAPAPPAAAPSALLSDADLGLAPHPAATAQPGAPNPSGPLANSADDGYLSGAAKGLGTAAVKAYGNTVGFVGGLSGFEDYLMARAEAKIRGVPVEQAQADMAARRAKTEAGMAQSPLGRLALASDPTRTMPTPDSAAAPILARTGEYQPTSELGKVALAGAETALSAMGPGVGAARGGIGALAAGAVRAAPVNAAIGAVSQGATDVTGDPLLGAAAGMVGVPLAEAGVSRFGQVAAPIIAGTPGLKNLPVVRAGVEARAGAGLLASASDPEALRRFAADPAPPPIVPGSPQTLAAAVGNDPGLFAAEKAARTASPETFNANDAERQKAQAAAIDAVQPEGDVFAPGALIRGRLDALDQAADRVEQHLNDRYGAATAVRAQAQQSDAVTAQADLAGRMLDRQGIAAAAKAQADTARQAPLDALTADHAAQEASLGQGARDAFGALGPTVAPEPAGAALRGAVEDVRGQVRRARSDLYKAVDPDGSLALVSSPVRDAADGILKGVDPYAAPLTADAQRLIGKARALPDVMPFSSLTAFEQDITQAMSAERRSAGETYSLKLLGDLKGSVQSAIYDAADNQHAHEARLRDAGVAPDGPGLQERLGRDWVYGDEPTAAGPASDRAASSAVARARPGAARPGGASEGAATGDAGRQGGGGSPPAPRDPDVPPQARLGSDVAFAEPSDETRFSAPAYDPDGGPGRAPPRPDVPRPQDLRAFVKARGGMIDTGGDLASMGMHDLIGRGVRGLDPDKMREAAAEAGYLGADTARAMRETHPNDLLDALSSDRPVHSVHDEDAAASWAAYDDAKERHDAARGGDPAARPAGPRPKAPLSAYSNDDIYPPGRAPEPANDALRPNFDDAAAGRLSTAKAAHADYAQTYRNGPVGAALKTNGFAGQYRTPDAGVMQAAFRRGPGGYEATKAFLDAAKSDPRAVQAIADHSLNELRVRGGPLGVLRQADVDRWAAAHEGSIRALEEVLPGYRGVVTDAARATDALMQAGVANKAVRKAAEDAAAADALEADKARAADLKGANEADRANSAAALKARVADDRAADQADKAERDAGVAQVRSVQREARATPAGQLDRAVGDAVAPAEVENRVGSLLSTGTSGATRMRGIVQSVQGNDAALAGLRRAGVTFLGRTFQNADGMISGARLIRFVRENRDTLNELYGPAGVNTFSAVARDAENMAAWRGATAAKGGSDTAGNLVKLAKEHGSGAAVHGSLMFVAADALKDALFEGHFDPKLAATAGFAFLANTLRQAGIRRVADLQRAAMLDPELARMLISKAPTVVHPEKLHALAGLVRRGLIVGPEMQRQRR